LVAEQSYLDRPRSVWFGRESTPLGERWRVWHHQRGGGHAIVGWLERALHDAGRSTQHWNHATSEQSLRERPATDAAVQIWSLEDESYDGTRVERDLFVLRDFVNLAASRYRAGLQHAASDDTERSWLEFASLRFDRDVLDYGRWFAEADYRCEWLERFGLPRDPRPYDRVARNGRGSSFDGTAFDGRAQQMAILDRWRQVADDPEFVRRTARHHQAIGWSLEVFGPRMSVAWCRFAERLLRVGTGASRQA
jgi:hypothetical protein